MIPKLICMTPVRNEAWILHAFLKTTSLWADHIIIADQGSTDGSREIALSYPKVILIDNNDNNYDEAVRQKLLIDKAREIEGDKILFGLDADEMFSANFKDTDDWKAILSSKPGDVFWFRWANICPDLKSYWTPTAFFPWMFHDDGEEPHGNYAKKIHSMRIPYPIAEKQMFYVNDFKVLHFGNVYPERNLAKKRMYKIIDKEQNQFNSITISRNYIIEVKDEILRLPTGWFYNKLDYGFALLEEIDLELGTFWYDNYIIDRFKKTSISKFKRLDIWDEAFLAKYNLGDPRSLLDKILHLYLENTVVFRRTYLIRGIDKLLSKLGV